MACQEQAGLLLEDGASRIFLNTHGTNGEGVDTELIELLHYMEQTTGQAASHSTSQRIKELHGRVSQLKASEEIGVKYIPGVHRPGEPGHCSALNRQHR